MPSFRLDALPPPQNLLHRAAQVVIPQLREHSAEILESLLVRFQERLLSGMVKRAVKSRAAVHAAHRKHLHLLFDRAQDRHRLEPIHLRLHAQVIALRHEDLPALQPEFPFPPCHVTPDAR